MHTQHDRLGPEERPDLPERQRGPETFARCPVVDDLIGFVLRLDDLGVQVDAPLRPGVETLRRIGQADELQRTASAPSVVPIRVDGIDPATHPRHQRIERQIHDTLIGPLQIGLGFVRRAHDLLEVCPIRARVLHGEFLR